MPKVRTLHSLTSHIPNTFHLHCRAIMNGYSSISLGCVHNALDSKLSSMHLLIYNLNRLCGLSPMTKIWLILLAYFCYCSTTIVALAGAIEFQSESTDKLPARENYFVASDKLITEQANPIDVLFQLKDDRRALMTHLYDRGYFDAYVAIFLNNAPIDNVLVVDAPDEIQSAQVSIRYGKQYKYGAVSVTPLGPKLAAQPAPSGTANLLEIQSYVSDIIDEWRALGYLQTDVAIQELIANHSNQTLDVNVRLNLGAKSVFNKLDLDTPTAVKTTKITEIVALKSGDPINAGTINTIETRL